MGKKIKKNRLALLVEAAEELNEVIGLEPAIETEGASEADLEEKLEEAARLITDEDEFTKQTESVLEEFLEAEEEEFEDEEFEEEFEDEDLEEEQEEDEDFEDEDFEDEFEDEVASLEEIREQVNGISKRKDLRIFAEENADIFQPVIEDLPNLKSSKKLKAAMLELLDQLENGEFEEEKIEAPEEEVQEAEVAEEVEEKPKKKKKRRGVIATIAQTIEDSGEKGVTKDEILEVLMEAFPNRKADSMTNTINVQVPHRISKQRFEIENIDGRYRKKQ